MIYSAVKHDYKKEMQSVIDLNTIEISLEAARDDLSRVALIYGPRYTDNKDAQNIDDLKLKYQTKYKDVFSIRLNLEDNRLRYLFYLEDQQGNRVWYNEKGFFDTRPRGYDSGYFQKAIINKSDLLKYPGWAEEAVIYQIFPDRFYRSNSNNYANKKWGEKPEIDSIFGGDLNGIIEKIDYLVELGINTIYLTPIFDSPSNHKYNTDDYYQIDSNFGTLEDAQKLCQKANENGIRVIIDAVFNHSSSNFFAFKDLIKNGKKSKYINWYFPESFPLSKEETNYSTFANNVTDMPRLNLDNAETQKYFLDLAEYWTKNLDLSGWRLDVADEVSKDFWKKFRSRIKEINSDIFIIGEVWYRASNWLDGSTFDSVMNYDLQRDIKSLLIDENIEIDQFSAQIQDNFRHYHPLTPKYLINLLDSHDTERFNWNIQNLTKEEINTKMKFAFALQLLLPGIPLIYYGSEIGMTGDDDPDCRRTMIWDQNKQNLELLEYYKRAINFYKNNQELKKGNYKEVFSDPLKDVLVFSRKYNNQESIIILNLSEVSQKLKNSDLIDMIQDKKISFYLRNSKNKINFDSSFKQKSLEIERQQILVFN